MHKTNFDNTSTLVCEHDSMDDFMFKIQMAARFVANPDYKNFLLFQKKDAGSKVQNPVARFVQLPPDYFLPEDMDFCAFFAELAWKEDGAVMVEVDKFALCMLIWSLKQWLVCPTVCSYPLSCGKAEGLDCRCRNLIRAMWTDENLRKFFQDKTSFLRIDVDENGDDVEYETSMALQEQMSELEDAGDEMKNYAWKLVLGEETIRSGSGFSFFFFIRNQLYYQQYLKP